jgi:hypothetical protein
MCTADWKEMRVIEMQSFVLNYSCTPSTLFLALRIDTTFIIRHPAPSVIYEPGHSIRDRTEMQGHTTCSL